MVNAAKISFLVYNIKHNECSPGGLLTEAEHQEHYLSLVPQFKNK